MSNVEQPVPPQPASLPQPPVLRGRSRIAFVVPAVHNQRRGRARALPRNGWLYLMRQATCSTQLYMHRCEIHSYCLAAACHDPRGARYAATMRATVRAAIRTHRGEVRSGRWVTPAVLWRIALANMRS